MPLSYAKMERLVRFGRYVLDGTFWYRYVLDGTFWYGYVNVLTKIGYVLVRYVLTCIQIPTPNIYMCRWYNMENDF